MRVLEGRGAGGGGGMALGSWLEDMIQNNVGPCVLCPPPQTVKTLVGDPECGSGRELG